MKKLLATTLLISLGTAANAQLAFNGANIIAGATFQQNAGLFGS